MGLMMGYDKVNIWRKIVKGNASGDKNLERDC